MQSHGLPASMHGRIWRIPGPDGTQAHCRYSMPLPALSVFAPFVHMGPTTYWHTCSLMSRGRVWSCVMAL